jgi:hypothetical protein
MLHRVWRSLVKHTHQRAVLVGFHAHALTCESMEGLHAILYKLAPVVATVFAKDSDNKVHFTVTAVRCIKTRTTDFFVWIKTRTGGVWI